jgi:hypothetical protein
MDRRKGRKRGNGDGGGEGLKSGKEVKGRQRSEEIITKERGDNGRVQKRKREMSRVKKNLMDNGHGDSPAKNNNNNNKNNILFD